MALNYDVRENKNAFREITKEEYEREENKLAIFKCPKIEENDKFYEMTIECNMLIMLCGLVVGIPNITEENHERVFNRISIMENIGGTYLVDINPETNERIPHPFTLEIVKNNIGIKTNGIALNKREFENKVVSQLVNDKRI
jgi:hypothetical protein